jgi:hypothetical protein
LLELVDKQYLCVLETIADWWGVVEEIAGDSNTLSVNPAYPGTIIAPFGRSRS